MTAGDDAAAKRGRLAAEAVAFDAIPFSPQTVDRALTVAGMLKVHPYSMALCESVTVLRYFERRARGLAVRASSIATQTVEALKTGATPPRSDMISEIGARLEACLTALATATVETREMLDVIRRQCGDPLADVLTAGIFPPDATKVDAVANSC